MRHLKNLILFLLPLASACGSSSSADPSAAQTDSYEGQSVALQYMHIDTPGGISESLSVDNQGNVAKSTQRWCTAGCAPTPQSGSGSTNLTLTGDQLLQLKQQIVDAALFKLPTSYEIGNCTVIDTLKVQVDGQAVEFTVGCVSDLPAGLTQALSAVDGVLADF